MHDDEDDVDDNKLYPDYAGLRMSMKRCSVTAFDMRFEVSRDGRERGIWFWLKDASKNRAEACKRWVHGHIEKNAGIRAHMVKAGFTDHPVYDAAADPQCNGGRLNEAALLEWPAAVEIYKALGRELRRMGQLKPKKSKPKKSKPKTKKKAKK